MAGPCAGTAQTAPRDTDGDLAFIGLGCAFLLVVVTFNALNVLHEHDVGGHPVGWWEPAVWEGSSAIYFTAVAAPILAFARRFWLPDRPFAPKVAAHGLFVVLISLGHMVAIGAMRWSVYRLVGAHYDAFGPLGDWAYEMRKDAIVYAGLVVAYLGWRRLRAGEPVRPGAAQGAREDVLEVRDGARRHFVPLSDVVSVEAAGNYVELHRTGGPLLHRASLSSLQQRFERAGFVRIHRSRLVRRDTVVKVESRSTGDFVVRLRDGRELAGSRRYRRPLLAD